MVNNILIQETPSSKVTIYTVVSTVINLIIGVLILLISAIVIKGKLQVGNYLIFIVPSFVVIGLVVIIFLVKSNKSYNYYVMGDGVKSIYSFLSTKESMAKFEKITDIQISQGMWQKVFKIYSVSFQTAGSNISEVVFHNIDDPVKLRNLVSKKLGLK
jgi:membrane protein YdbS with pleckstrin-like domain|tara:strand:+ start:965 stop:1438 length:474 start_codon:yes stop_codon:yes gene_type:complete